MAVLPPIVKEMPTVAEEETFKVKDLTVIQGEILKEPISEGHSLGHSYASHMLCIEWANGKWGNPVIQPLAPLSLSPGASCLHYGVECFEGMKAFRCNTNEIALFRPLDHLRRLKCSASRICLPVSWKLLLI